MKKSIIAILTSAILFAGVAGFVNFKHNADVVPPSGDSPVLVADVVPPSGDVVV